MIEFYIAVRTSRSTNDGLDLLVEMNSRASLGERAAGILSIFNIMSNECNTVMNDTLMNDTVNELIRNQRMTLNHLTLKF